MTNITFTSHGDNLAGNIFIASQPRPLAFLLIQGWTGSQNVDTAQALADHGFTSLTYDMHGHGESEGDLAKYSRADFVQDAALAYDVLRQQVGKEAEIGVIGSSFGAYTAVLLSALRPVKCLSLRVPANYLDDGFDAPQLPQITTAELRIWRQQPSYHTGNKALRALHNFAGPVQIVEAANDEVVDHQTVANYAAAVVDDTQLTHHVMKDAPHRLSTPELRQEYRGLVVAWAEAVFASSPQT